ncbi:unnamed protein product [Adineta steineri]|uniref:Uncharacterized protein n=1 Tax=Adineta steineri TaxID=433720 RepID=A0A815PK98_9BILA|nr:unnamed protein product [Adineta steineri]CAF4112171.1 unnamed protein product [Adineta steineri]
MNFSKRYSYFFLLFLQYGEAIGLSLGSGLFGMFFPTIFVKQLCPWFSQSDVLEHPVLLMMTRMFCTTLLLLAIIEYSVVRYCTKSSTNDNSRATKEYILKIFVLCMTIRDLIHTCSYLNYYLNYGSFFELSSIGNLHLTIVLPIARIIFLWLNYQNKNAKQRKE